MRPVTKAIQFVGAAGSASGSGVATTGASGGWASETKARLRSRAVAARAKPEASASEDGCDRADSRFAMLRRASNQSIGRLALLRCCAVEADIGIQFHGTSLGACFLWSGFSHELFSHNTAIRAEELAAEAAPTGKATLSVRVCGG